MNNTLEMQVTLGLSTAKQQVEQLRTALERAVKPDSNTFASMNKYLKQLTNQAENLGQKLSSSFKTSGSSKAFLKEYEQLMSGIKYALGSFSKFNISDLILSEEDQQIFDDLTKKVTDLQKELLDLRKGKIGNFFEDSTIENADKVKKVAEDLKLTLNDMKFSELSSALGKEFKTVNNEINKATEKVKSLQSQIDTLSVNKISNVRDQIQEAFNAATTGKSFKTDTTSYQELLRNFYDSFSDYKGKKSLTVKSGGAVEEFIKSEINAITTGCEQMRQKTAEYNKIKQELTDAFKANPGNKSKDAIQQILKAYKIDDLFKDIDVSQNWTKYWGEISKRLTEVMSSNGIISDEAINKLQADMLAKIKTLFDGADLDKVVDVSRFRAQVTAILKSLNLDLSDAEMGKITNAIVKGFDLSAILDTTETTLTEYSNKVKETKEKTVAELDELKAKAEDLKSAQGAVNADGLNTKQINKEAQAFQKASEAVDEYIEKKQKAVAGDVPKAPSDALEKGQKVIKETIASLTQLEKKQKTLGNIQMAVDRWMGFWQVLNLGKRAINDMKKHIQELDTVMTSIAVVTNMSQDDLWGQISKYSEIARQYGVAIKGVYEVSQIYYQQGLQSNDVMTLTTETLKMARIAGLDYATAADYMTTAIRGFKLEMQDASHVTDVFSALAATTASSTEELAVAISKTAASAEAVGSSFEATTAMMATMIATTRESATNIGTALKSVISRYGEMTADPTALRDSEGEEMSLNRVDAALQTVGITIHDVAGQFRDFDDVLLELMEKWDSLDSLSQRYIATLMAGNRQQSRFLALVSNVDEYKKALQTANDAAGTGDLQTLKTLDSIDAKIEKMKVTIQEFYTSSGIQDLYKTILDTITNIVSAGNSLPKVFGSIPGTALAVAGSLISIIKNTLTMIISLVQSELKVGAKGAEDETVRSLRRIVTEAHKAGKESGQGFWVEFRKQGGVKQLGLEVGQLFGQALSLAGAGLSIKGLSKYGASTSEKEDREAGTLTLGGALANLAGSALSGAAMGSMAGGPGAVIGALQGTLSSLITIIPNVISGISQYNVTLSRQIELSEKAAAQAQENVTRAKGEEKALETSYNQLKQLEEARYNSAEAEQEYIDYMNQLKDSYPALVENIDALGNATITSTTLEEQLAKARQETAKATINSIESEIKTEQTRLAAYEQIISDSNALKYDWREAENYLANQSPSDNWKFYRTSNMGGQGTLSEQILHYMTSGKHESETADRLNDWYSKYKTYHIDIGNDADKAQQYLLEHPEIEQDFIKEMVSSSYISEIIDPVKNQIRTILDNIPDNLGISLDEITNIEDFSLDQIDSMKGSQLIDLLENIRKHAKDYITNTNETLSTYNDTLSRAKTDRDVDIYLTELNNSTEAADKQLYNQIKDYSSFISFVLDSMFPSYIDFNAGDNQAYRKQVTQWVSEHQELASRMMQADYTSYRTMGDFYTDFAGVEGTIVDQGWSKQFAKIREEAVNGLANQLTSIFGQSSELFTNLTNDNITDGELTTQNISYLRTGLTHYQDLVKDGQHAVASAYLNSLNQVFNQIGALDSFKQTEIAPIISSLDFTSSDSLTKAAEQLQTMGGFDDLVNTLNTAATRLMYNVGAMTQRLQSSLQETIENVEKAAENAGKGAKYSEAYKNAAEILTKYDGTEELVFDDIYQYNEAVGGYLLTRRGLELQLSQQSADAAKQIEEAKTQANTMYNFLDSSYFNQKWTTNFADEEWRKSQVNSFKQTFGISEPEAQAYLTQMQKIYEEYDGSIDWDTYIEEQKEQYEELMQVNEDMYQSLITNSIGMSIVSLDYAKIASGEGSYLKDTLAAYLAQLGLNIDSYWNDLLEGKVDSLNQALKDTGVNAQISKETSKAAIKSEIDQQLTALNELTNQSITTFSEGTQKWLEETYHIAHVSNKDQLPEQVLTYLINQIQSNLQGFVNSGNLTLEEYNNLLVSHASKAFGDNAKAKAVIDMAKDGISQSELGNFATQFGQQFNNLWDEAGKTFKNADLAAVFKWDDKTQSMIPKAEATGTEIINALAAAFNVTLSGFEDFALETIDGQIAQRAKDNKGKQIASQLQNLSSAKIGDEVNISSLTDDMKQVLLDNGYITDLTQETLTVESTARIDSLLLLLRSSIEAYDEDGKEALRNVYNDINKNILSKRNISSATTGIIASKVSQSAAETFVAAIGYDITATDQIMRERGYLFNQYTQEWEATAVVLHNLSADLEAARKTGTAENVANIQAAYNKLKAEIVNQRTNAIQDIVSNYSNISEESIAAFETAFAGFGINIRDYIDTDALGNQKVNLAALNQALAQVGYDVNQLFQEEIAAIGDSYLQAISSGVSILSSGTNNLADISKIAKDLDPNLTAQDIGYYDEILKAWTIDGNVVRQYVEKQAEKLKAMGIMPEDQVDKWVEQNTKGIASENIDIMGFLSSNRTQDDINKIGKALETYAIVAYKTLPLENIFDYINGEIQLLQTGGLQAVWAAQQLKPTLTESELAEIYSNAINRWNDAFNEIENVVVGEVVTGDLRKILSQLGMIDGPGIVNKTFDMVEVYSAIYNQMKLTAGNTITGLNSAYAKLLTAKDQKNIDAIEAIGDAMGMSYDALGELLARYGRSLEDELNNLYYERLGNGKVRITDFTQFASDLGLDTNSEEYLSAFKQYNESLIELDRKTAKNIKDELSNLISAKAGTRLDISQLSNALGEDTINGLIHQYGGFVQDGILSLATQTDIPGMFAAIRDKIQSGENRTIQLTETELGELQDAIDGLLSNIISLISTGVSGSLNHAQAAELKSWASANGIQNLDFESTVDGLKLTEESFFNLYATLSKINKLESKKLLPDMQKMSRSYGDLLSATREYNRTLTEAANDNNANKRQGLQDLIKSYLQDPNTYKTMGQQLPTEWQIAQNFYEDAYSGMQVLKAASAKKIMGVEDFYSMINTAGSLNPNFAINGMGMDELLDAAANSLQIVDGKLSVNLEKAGITAKNGMKQFSEGWLAGLENLRRTESGYLEAYTRLSKVHDAMGKLQPIDFNLFDSDSGKFTQNAIDYLNNLGTQLGEDVTDGILFNGISLSQLLLGKNPAAAWAKAGFKDNASISAFIKNLSQVDFNADDIVSQLEQLTSENPMTIRMNNEHGFIAIEPTGNVIDINWDDKTVQKNIQQFVGKKLKPKTIKDTIEEAYANKDSVDFNAQVQARAILALASGQIDTSGFTRDKKGHWSGYYNGQLYTGNDYATLVERITKSMLASESGFQVTLEDGEPVTGTKYVNGAEITLDIREGTYSAKFGNKKGGPFDTKEALNEWIALNVGGGDTESHFEIDGTDYGVYIDEQTGLSYTKWVDDDGKPHWKYHGHDFTEYSAFLAYAKSLREYSKYGEVSDSKDGNTTTITIDENASIEMEITPDSVTTTYWFKGQQLTKEAFDQYLAAQNEGTFTLDTDGSMHYEHSGMTVNVEIKDGKVLFSITVDGATFTGDKATVEAAIGTYVDGQMTALNPSTGEVNNGLTVTYSGYIITISTDGTISYQTSDGSPISAEDVRQQLGEAGAAKLGEIEQSAKVAISSVQAEAAEGGATATVDNSLKETIKAAIAEIPADIKVTAETDGAAKAIKALGDAIKNLQDKTVNVTVIEKVSKAKGSNIPTKTPKTPPGLRPNILEEKILGAGSAQGNVALAGGRSTLMGELGPELYVTNGHYYIAGKNGAEFVDLPDDAIVFNHLQTRKLLDKGASGRGRAVTNEQKAVAQARGNMNGGSAMAGSNTMETPTLKVTGLSSYKVGPVDVATVELDKDAKNAVKSLIQDVLNKGFKNINLKDYEKLPADIAAKVDLSGSYRKFVTEYGKMIGLTTDELNKMIIQGFEKDNPLIFAKKDIFEELEFTKEGNDTFALFDDGMVEEIAAAYEWSSDQLNAFYDEAAKYFDYASGKYKVSIDTLKKQYNTDILDYAKAHDKATNSDNLNKKLQEDLQKNNENALKEYEDSMRKHNIVQDLEFLGDGIYKVTTDQLKEIADAWGMSFEDVKAAAEQQADGSFNLDSSKLNINFADYYSDEELQKKLQESREKANADAVAEYEKSIKKQSIARDLDIVSAGIYKVTLSDLENIANAWGISFEELKSKVTDNLDGTFTLNEETVGINLSDCIPVDQLQAKLKDSFEKANADAAQELEEEQEKFNIAKDLDLVTGDIYNVSIDTMREIADAWGIKFEELKKYATPQDDGTFNLNLKNAGINLSEVLTESQLAEKTQESLEKANDQVVEEINKSTRKADAVADLNIIDENIFNGSLDQLKEFANAFGLDLNDVMKAAIKQADGTYNVDLRLSEKLSKINLAELILPDSMVDKIQDSIAKHNADLGAKLERQERDSWGLADAFNSNIQWDVYNDQYTASYSDLEAVFNAAGKKINEDWVNSLARNINGDYIFTGLELEQQVGVFPPEVRAKIQRGQREQALAAEKELASNFSNIISTVMEQGVDAIDWREYEDLDPKIVEMIKGDANLSKADFAAKYAAVAGKTLKEANALLIEGITADEEKTRGMYDLFSSSVTWDPYYELFTASGDTLASIFSTQGKQLTKEWLDTLKRDEKGNYKVSMQDLESQGIVFDKNLFEGYERWLQEQAKAREEQIHNDLSNVISTYIDQGFNAIDFRDYFDLPTETVQLIKESAELSKRDFVVRFAEAAGKTVSEMNQLYFEAWEKDIGLEATEAAKNMQYYFGGGMSGSSTDWQALLGDSVKVSELVRLGLLEYDEALNTYYSKNVEEIEQLTGIDIDDDAITDSIRTAFESIADQIMVGLDGALSNTDATKLKANLKHMGLGDVELDFSQGLEGLQLSQASAISLYTQLKKIDAIQANLMFKKLRESLEKSNDKYKTMTSLLKNIYELQEKIDHAERYNPEKIKQFQEELALAKEIAAVRATSEDESFNFLDQDIPAAMNNPLNYTKNWIEAAKSMDEAWKNGKAYDFTRFYNIVNQINDVAKMTGMSLDFLGFTLDGSIDAVDAIIRHGIDKLGTDADMDFGVMFSDWGEGLEMGSQEFANGANNAIHAMALSQIKILDSLIAMFQAIVAMEEFEGADLDMNGMLDFGEVFADFELGDEAETYTLQFQDAAQKILKMADANKEVQAALEQVKVNDVSMMEMLRDTTDGQRNVALTASEYQTAVSVFYEMLKSGDFDINNIAQSLRENLAKNHSNFKGVIETKDMVIDMSYDIAINKTKDGKYKTPGGKEYDTAVEATKAGAVEAAGIKADEVQFDPITKNAYGTIEIADTEVTVTAYGKGKRTWKVDDQEYGSEEAAIKAIYNKSDKKLSFEAWKIDQEITAPVKVIQDVEVSSISKEQASHLVGKTFDQIKQEYDDAKGDHVLELEFQARYGFKLDESSTSEDFEKLKEASGIESKNVEITASVQMAEGSDAGLVGMLESGSATVTVDVVFNKGEDTAAPEAAEIPVSADTTQAEENINAAVQSADNAQGTIKADSDTSKAEENAQAAASRMDLLKAAITVGVNDFASGPLNAIAEAVNNIPSSKDITITETTVKKEEDSSTSESSSQAKGNVSGGAMAKGTRTLMGELGPELYVTSGHYYIAGRDGAEFVDLPDDAIVFNHLQTAGLLGKGSAGRGRPITNEHNAVSMATGSLGPAAASAKETLAALQQLRAMWQKLADSTIVDLAGVGGSNLSNIAGWVDEVERWYNLLQKIAQLEKDINYQEALRRKIETDRIRDGALYYKTLQDSYDNYIEQANSHRELYESQQQYFNQRREELNSEKAPFSKFYTYDENAQIKFKDGGYAALADLVKQYDTGELKYTPDEQYNIMKSYGLLQYGQYDSSGKEIKSSDFEDQREYRLAVVKAIWEKMDKEREEMQSLHDSIEENKTAYLEALTNGNELLQKVIDNQIQVENDVLAAIESREQAIIDELSEQRDQLQKEADKYIKGLNDALSKERQLYEKNNEGSELTRLERQLAILRRSGGSASQIRSLESEIDSKRQDQYFSLQEEQINAVQEAADAQIQRLDTQIELMQETLAFEKAHGMLWAEVEQIMAGSSNEIVSFLATYSKDYAAQSTIQQQEWIREKQFEADLWAEYRSNAPDTIAEGIQKGSEPVAEERYNPEEFSMEKLKTDEKNPAAGSSSSSGSSHSGGYSGGGGYSASTVPEKDMKDYDRQVAREKQMAGKLTTLKQDMEKMDPKSLQYQDANAAYKYYEQEQILAQTNIERIKKGDKTYVPDYTNQGVDTVDKMKLPSAKPAANAAELERARSQVAASEATLAAAKAQRRAYLDAGLTEDSQAIIDINKGIADVQGWIEAGRKEIEAREKLAKSYKKGGIIDYTGLAMVHGTPSEPEAVLNSKDYKLWKQSIGSNVWESLERERLEIQALHDTFNSVITNSSDSSIVIEKAEVNVNVEQIANDYDAKRMGEQALQEMVRIARKTGTATIRR